MIGRISGLNTAKEFDLEFKPMFEALKLSSFDKAVLCHKVNKLNNDRCLVSFAWKFYNKQGIELSKVSSIYNLKQLDGEWKIISVILHNYYKYVALTENF
jgi:hypothetical protein